MSILKKAKMSFANWVAAITLFAAATIFSVGAYVIWWDLTFYPIANVTTQVTEAYPGGIARMVFTYDRDRPPRFIKVQDRQLICNGGRLYSVSAEESSSTAWPPGKNQTATIKIRMPPDVKPGENCYYSSSVWYGRYLLPPILYKIPPEDAHIKVVEG